MLAGVARTGLPVIGANIHGGYAEIRPLPGAARPEPHQLAVPPPSRSFGVPLTAARELQALATV